MSDRYPLVIIGAGPAGLCAATAAAERGVAALVLDEQPTPGGQIYRAADGANEARRQVLGPDYQRGSELIEAFRRSGAGYWPHTSVWSINERREIGILRQGRARVIRAERVILAGGALERPVPFVGWTLPGVMNAGAAQILLKSSGVVPRETVIAGVGPLPLLVAWQYVRAGVHVKAVLELAPHSNLLRAAPHLLHAIRAGDYLRRGVGYLRELRRRRVPLFYGVEGLRATGEGRVEAVEFRHGAFARHRHRSVATETLLVSFGVIPHTDLSRAIGCEHDWDGNQQCWVPRVDLWGNTTVPGVAAVGDGAGISGARSAEHSGRLAALEAARALGLLSGEERDRRGAADLARMRVDLRVRPFLEALQRLPDGLLAVPDDTTVVCRCEEVTAGQIRQAVRDGHHDPNQVKSILRCGMGACQGRQCAPAIAHIVAGAAARPVQDFEPLRMRPPLRPLSIEQLATLTETA